MEIGSILEFDKKELYDGNSDGTDFFTLPFMNGDKYNVTFRQNARNATEDLCLYLKDSISCVILPDYVCSTVPDAVIRAGVPVKYYHIRPDFSFDVKEIDNLMSTESSLPSVLYIVHYFGKPLDLSLVNAAKKWMAKGYPVFEDITMSIFSKDEGMFGFGSYIIGSLRKWLPIPDGGFICSKNLPLPEISNDAVTGEYCRFSVMAQELKRDYITGGEKDSELKDTYMNYYRKSVEYLFSDYSIRPVSDITRHYLANYSVDEIIEKRTENYKYLYNLLKDFDFLKPLVAPKDNYLPFGMVISCPERDDLLSFLVSKDVYCNIHWRLDNPDMGVWAKALTKTVITIPCDQRYNTKDFDRIADVLTEYSKR